MNDAHAREILDRARRIETRVTRIAKAMGVDPGETQPSFDPEYRTLSVPSRHISLQDCLKSIPARTNVSVVIGGDLVGYISKE